MEKITLKASTREDLGTGSCKSLRREGKVPSVVYKGGKQGINVTVDRKEVWHALHTEAGENAIITMDIESGGKNTEKTVIVKADSRNQYGIVMDLIDQIKISGGIDYVVLATQKNSSGRSA